MNIVSIIMVGSWLAYSVIKLSLGGPFYNEEGQLADDTIIWMVYTFSDLVLAVILAALATVLHSRFTDSTLPALNRAAVFTAFALGLRALPGLAALALSYSGALENATSGGWAGKLGWLLSPLFAWIFLGSSQRKRADK